MSAAMHKDSGFSLIEMLVALFLFAVLSSGATLALTQTLNVRERLQSQQDSVSDWAVQRAILQSDLDHFTPRPARDENGQFRPYRFVLSTAPILAFTRDGRPNPDNRIARTDALYIEYALEDGALIRRAWPINPAPTQRPHERVLLTDVRKIDAVLLQGRSETRQLFSPRGDIQELPPLLSFAVTFEDGRTLSHILELRQ